MSENPEENWPEQTGEALVWEPVCENGAETDAPPSVCRCGAPAHETNRNICAKGHARRGNALAKISDAPDDSPLPTLVDAPALDSVAEAERLVVVLNAEIAKVCRRKRPNPRDLTMLAAQLLKTREFLDARPRPEASAEVQASAFVRSLPDDLLLALLAFADGHPYTLPARFAPAVPAPVALSAPTVTAPEVGTAGPCGAGWRYTRDVGRACHTDRRP